jgi:hypothetical protein
MKTKIALLFFGCVIVLCSFVSFPNDGALPRTMTRTSTLIDGREVQRTTILFDKNTSREDVINTCNYLQRENIYLTFDKLSIGPSFLGVIGRQRINLLEGKIQLPDGSSKRFEAGGKLSFRYLKLQFTTSANASRIEMIETVD